MRLQLIYFVLLVITVLSCTTNNEKKYFRAIKEVLKVEGYTLTNDSEFNEIAYDSEIVRGIRQLSFKKNDTSVMVIVTVYKDEKVSTSDAGADVQIAINKIIAKSNSHYRGWGGMFDVNIKIYSTSPGLNREVDRLYEKLKARLYQLG